MSNFKKVLATLCSATLIVSSSLTAFASSGVTPEAGTTGGAGNIVAYSVETVTVPTAVKVSFNPQGWDFTLRGDTTSNAQIVSLNYGIASAATLDKKITVSFAAEGTEGSGEEDITFVDTKEKAQAKSDSNTDGAAPGEYKMYLAVAPSTAAVAKGYAANGDPTDFEVVNGASTVTTALLGDVDMTAATVGVQVFKDDAAEISYKLNKAVYVLKDDTPLDFTATQTTIANKFETDTLGSIVGFTFVGAMNPNVDWTKAKITSYAITPTYEVEDVDGTETVITGDGAPYNVIGEAAAAAATEVQTSYDSATTTYSIELPSGTTISATSDVTNLKVDGAAFTGTINKNNSGSKIKLTREDVKTAATTAGTWSTGNLTITFTINGTNYTTSFNKG